MSHYNVANSKPATMWHYLKSLLLHGISKTRYNPASLKAWYDPAPLKACCYTAPFTKPIVTWQYFTKSQNHFHKTQIIIWQLFFLSPNTYLALISLSPNTTLALILQSLNNNLTLISLSPNTNLTLFYKTQILIWHLFHKAQIIIWQQFFLKPK